MTPPSPQAPSRKRLRIEREAAADLTLFRSSSRLVAGLCAGTRRPADTAGHRSQIQV